MVRGTRLLFGEEADRYVDFCDRIRRLVHR